MNYFLYITRFFPGPSNWSGAYSLDFVKSLARHMEKIGELWKILVFVPGAREDYEVEGVKVYRFAERKLPSAIFPMLFARWNKKSFLRKVEDVIGSAGMEKCMIAHANTASCGVYALAVKAQHPKCFTLLHHHDLSSFGLNSGILHTCWLHNVIQYPILRRMHEKIDCHVFISEASRRSFLNVPKTDWTVYEDYRKQYRGLGFYRSPSINKSYVLYNGVDDTVFHPATNLPRQNTSPIFTIGCIGNFQELKDQLTLLRAFLKLREEGCDQICLKFIGGDSTLGHLQKLKGARSYLSRCKQFVEEHHLEGCVEFQHEVDHDQLPAFYRSLDLFVLPSYFEGFGCVYTESWSCGVPFIACKGQGMDDLIAPEDRDRWLCEPKNPVDLAMKIKAYMDNRWIQKLTKPVDIGTIVGKFTEAILTHINPQGGDK